MTSINVRRPVAGIVCAIGAVIITACAADTATGASPEPVMVNEGNYVRSWCATTTPGFRMFWYGPNSPALAAATDPTCHPTH